MVNEILNDQLNDIRNLKHDDYLKCNKSNDVHKFKRNTLLCVSDSIINKLNRLSRKELNVKVRCFSGSTIYDMYYYIAPLLKNNPNLFCYMLERTKLRTNHQRKY